MARIKYGNCILDTNTATLYYADTSQFSKEPTISLEGKDNGIVFTGDLEARDLFFDCIMYDRSGEIKRCWMCHVSVYNGEFQETYYYDYEPSDEEIVERFSLEGSDFKIEKYYGVYLI